MSFLSYLRSALPISEWICYLLIILQPASYLSGRTATKKGAVFTEWSRTRRRWRWNEAPEWDCLVSQAGSKTGDDSVGSNRTDFRNKTLKIASPRLFSIAPNENEDEVSPYSLVFQLVIQMFDLIPHISLQEEMVGRRLQLTVICLFTRCMP